MSLIERLEAEIRRQDRKVADAMSRDFYNQPAADLRELLIEVLQHIKAEPPAYMQPGNWVSPEVYAALSTKGYVVR